MERRKRSYSETMSTPTAGTSAEVPPELERLSGVFNGLTVKQNTGILRKQRTLLFVNRYHQPKRAEKNSTKARSRNIDLLNVPKKSADAGDKHELSSVHQDDSSEQPPQKVVRFAAEESVVVMLSTYGRKECQEAGAEPGSRARNGDQDYIELKSEPENRRPLRTFEAKKGRKGDKMNNQAIQWDKEGDVLVAFNKLAAGKNPFI